MRLASVGTAFPPHTYSQDQLLAALKHHWGQAHHNVDRLDRLHENVLVGGRHLALPLEAYPELQTFGDANDAWIRTALEVGEAAIVDALDLADLTPEDVDHLFTVTVTGVATPSLDARLMNRLDFRSDLRRTPIFGLGCVAGAAGISRAADWVKGHPEGVAVLLSVELCSLTLQRQDVSIPNLIASGLFGDGAAAVVVTGTDREPAAPPGPRVVATRAVFYPDTEEVMGWDVSESGFRIVLSADVPKVAEESLPGDVDRFLAEQGLTRDDVSSWVCHTGGPKVLEAIERGLELPDGALDLSWKSLREVGNLSSTSVLLVLRDTLENQRPEPGSLGMLLAMGPGFCSELVLLEW